MKCYYHPDRDAVGQCSRCSKFACRECIEDVGGAMLCSACQRLAVEELETETDQTAGKARKRIYIANMLAMVGMFAGLLMGLDEPSWEVAVVATPALGYLAWGLAWGWLPVWRRWSAILSGWSIYAGELFVWTMTLFFFYIPVSIAIGYGCLGGGIKQSARAHEEMRAEGRRDADAKIEEARMSLFGAFMFAFVGVFLGSLIALDEQSWEIGVVAIPGVGYLGWGLYWGWSPVWRKWNAILGGWSVYAGLFVWAMTLLFWFIPVSLAIGYGCLGGGIKPYLRARAIVRAVGWDTVAQAREAATRFMEQGRDKEALAALERLLAQRPNDAVAWRDKGNALLNLNRLQEALDASERARALHPDDAVAWQVKGTVLLNMERWQEALEALDRAVALAPNEACPMSGKGAALSMLGRHEEALHVLEQALALDPNVGAVWHNKSSVLLELHRYQEALDASKRAVTLEPDNATVWVGKGAALNELHRTDEAMAAFDRALTLDPNLDEAWYGKALAFSSIGRDEEAVAAYDHVLAINPTWDKAQRGKAEVLEKLARARTPDAAHA